MSRSALVVDDEPGIIEICSAYLRRDGFSVRAAFCGRQALEAVEVQRPDIVILDLMLPDISGEEVCSVIRRDSDLPILMLTAKSSEADRLRGLDLGADDYLVKPFSPRELVARARAILRRSAGPREPWTGPIVVDGGRIEVDVQALRASFDGAELELTKTEFRLFAALCRQPGRVFSRRELLEAIQGHHIAGLERTADVHVMKLRRKLDDAKPGASRCLATVYGSGYRLDVAR